MSSSQNEEEVVSLAMTDVIADMLTRIRNANDVGHPEVEIPCSNMKKPLRKP